MTTIFLDTASVKEIRAFLSWGIGEGVTTNQKIFLTEGEVDFKARVLEICDLVNGPVSVETTGHTLEDLVAEAREYSGWHRNVVVKVAMYPDGLGLKVVKQLAAEGIRTNMTCMVAFNQLWLAAKAGATFVSLFFNRARDAGLDPVATIRDIMAVLGRNPDGAKLIVGSIRKPEDVVEVVSAGAHIVTIPGKILGQLPFHSKTVETIKEFDDAWLAFQAKNKMVGAVPTR